MPKCAVIFDGPSTTEGSLTIARLHFVDTMGKVLSSQIRWQMWLRRAVAQFLLLPNLTAGTSALIPIFTVIALRIPREERAMIDVFGDACAGQARFE